jgi:hypothetical protein
LSTADGIFNGELFRVKNGVMNTLKKQLDKKRYLKEFGDLLLKMSPIDSGYSKAEEFNSSLNRHKVMHGKDVNYGTKINSLKALSLLAFICDFFKDTRN